MISFITYWWHLAIRLPDESLSGAIITRAVLVFATERKNNVDPRLRALKKWITFSCFLLSNWCTFDVSNIYEWPTYRTRSTKVKRDQINDQHYSKVNRNQMQHNFAAGWPRSQNRKSQHYIVFAKVCQLKVNNNQVMCHLSIKIMDRFNQNPPSTFDKIREKLIQMKNALTVWPWEQRSRS